MAESWWVVDVENYPDCNILGRHSTEASAKKTKSMLRVPRGEIDTLIIVPANGMFEAIEKVPQFSRLGDNWFRDKTKEFYDISDVIRMPDYALYQPRF